MKPAQALHPLCIRPPIPIPIPIPILSYDHQQAYASEHMFSPLSEQTGCRQGSPGRASAAELSWPHLETGHELDLHPIAAVDKAGAEQGAACHPLGRPEGLSGSVCAECPLYSLAPVCWEWRKQPVPARAHRFMSCARMKGRAPQVVGSMRTGMCALDIQIGDASGQQEGWHVCPVSIC